MQARLKDRRKQVFNKQNRRYCCVCLVNGEKQTTMVCSMKDADDMVVFNERS